MLPVVLGRALHDQQAAMRQRDGNLPLFVVAAEMKIPLGAKTDRGNGGVAPQFRLIIGMPAHGVLAVPVPVQQHGIEAAAGNLLDPVTY